MRASLRLPIATLLIAVLLGGYRVGAFSLSHLYEFRDPFPYPSRLTIGIDGAFYGTCESGGAYDYGYIFRLTTNGTLTTLASFANTNGATPRWGLVAADDGTLYGTTTYGGSALFGTIFRVTINGDLTTLISFTDTNGPNYGGLPIGLTLRRDGVLMGVTERGGNGCSCGTVFQITTGGVFTSLATIDFSTIGSLPSGCLVEGPDAAFYGTMSSGGPGYGTIYRVTSGGALSRVASFSGTNGSQPMAGVIFAADGFMYGTTYLGGPYYGSSGTIFRCSTNGSLTTLYTCQLDSNGLSPRGNLVQDKDGTLYGSMSGSWPYGSSGTVFKIDNNGVFSRLVTFWETNGASPIVDLIIGSDGAVYGTTSGGGEALAGTAYRITATGEFATLAGFRASGGATPQSTFFQGANRLLYGTTVYGGTNGVGTVFGMTTNGNLIMSASCSTDTGANPSSPLLAEPGGDMFGLASKGGAYGYGSVYRVKQTGQIDLVASFGLTNGSGPSGAFCIGDDGALYGATSDGGANVGGSLFRVTTNGALDNLASFAFSAGIHPQGGIIRGRDGAFYGSTTAGGSYSAGTVFRATTGGALTALASFDPSTVGSSARSALVEGPDGAFYGTTYYSTSSGYGAIYRVTTNGVLTRLFNFVDSSGPQYPVAPLIAGPDGALYGTSLQGGLFGNGGTVYRVTTNGILSTLANFCACENGQQITAGVMLAVDNKLYGVASLGVGVDSGSVFSLDLSSFLQPPLKVGNAQYVVSFSGMPNVVYNFQRAGSVSGPWSTIATVRPDFYGNGVYTNSAAPTGRAFYRLMIK